MEILSNIFVLCLPDCAEKLDFRQAPLVLTHVCREWRMVAQGTPRLWTNVCLADYNDKALSLSALKVWLSCSEPLPLNVVSPCMDDVSIATHFRYFRALCDHSAGWQDVHFGLGDEEVTIALVANLGRSRDKSNPHPMLSRFSLECSSEMSPPLDSDCQWSPFVLDALRSSPNLQTL